MKEVFCKVVHAVMGETVVDFSGPDDFTLMHFELNRSIKYPNRTLDEERFEQSTTSNGELPCMLAGTKLGH